MLVPSVVSLSTVRVAASCGASGGPSGIVTSMLPDVLQVVSGFWPERRWLGMPVPHREIQRYLRTSLDVLSLTSDVRRYMDLRENPYGFSYITDILLTDISVEPLAAEAARLRKKHNLFRPRLIPNITDNICVYYQKGKK